MSFDHLPRIYTVDKRIVESERFFRIEEAEARAKANRETLEKGIKAKLKAREKSKKEGTTSPSKMGLLPEVAPPHFFSAHVLTKDPEAAKWLDYTEVVFPKPYNVLADADVTVQPDFIHNVWISGFLDRSNRDALAIARQAAVKKAKEVSKKKKKKKAGAVYEDVSSVDSSTHKSLDDGSSIGDAAGGGGRGGRNDGSDSLASIKKFKPLRDQIAHIGGQASTLSQDISNLESSQGSVASRSVLSSVSSAKARFYSDIEAAEQAKERAAEARRLAQEKRKSEKKHIVEMMKPYQEQITDYLIRKQTGNWMPVRKTEEEERAAAAEAAGGAAAEELKFASFLSVDLDRIFDKERQEHEAATRIQKWWKKFKRLVPWDFIVSRMLAAARIQRMVRGVITRVWVAKWFNSRSKVVTKIQANIRRYQSNKRTKPRLALEQKQALQIQRIVRGKIGRLRWSRIRWDIAAQRLQALWRGVVARAQCDKKWLDRVVVPIQQMARKFSARHYVEKVRKEVNAAAMVIQKKVRSRQSCQKLTRKLIAREIEYRMDSISMLTADEEYWQEKIGKIITRLMQKDMRAKAEEANLAYHQGLLDVYNSENDYVEMMRQKEILSPRAIMQGYYQELNRNCIDLRDKLTELKKDVLFKRLMHHHHVDTQFEHQVKTVVDLAGKRDRLNKFRDAENAEKLERTQERDLFDRNMKLRQAIAAERRRWQVRYTTRNGKPDKNRRPGRPWDKSIVAGPDKQTYQAASVDIFAEGGTGNLRPGETGSVEQTLQRMSLQTYLEEVNAYEQILAPIQQAMQGFMGGPPNKPQPEDLGFGPEGKKLAPAMWNIGAWPFLVRMRNQWLLPLPFL